MTFSPEVNLGQIATILALFCGLIGFLYVSKFRLDRVEKWQDKFDKKMDAFAKDNDDKHKEHRDALTIMSEHVHQLIGQQGALLSVREVLREVREGRG